MAGKYEANELKRIGEQSRGRLPPASAVQGMFLYEMQRDTEDEKLFDAAMFRLSRAETVSEAHKQRLEHLELKIQAAEKNHQTELKDVKDRITKLEDLVRVLTIQKSTESAKATIRLPISSPNGQTLVLSVPKGSALVPLKEKRPSSPIPVDLRESPLVKSSDSKTPGHHTGSDATPIEPGATTAAQTPTTDTIPEATERSIQVASEFMAKEDKPEQKSSRHETTTSSAIDQWGGIVGQLLDEKPLPPVPAATKLTEVPQQSGSNLNIEHAPHITKTTSTTTGTNAAIAPKSKKVKWTEPPLRLVDSEPETDKTSTLVSATSSQTPNVAIAGPFTASKAEARPPLATYTADPTGTSTVLGDIQAIPRTKKSVQAVPPSGSKSSRAEVTEEPFKFSTKRPAVKITSAPASDTTAPASTAPSTTAPGLTPPAASFPVKPAPAAKTAKMGDVKESSAMTGVGAARKAGQSLNVNAPAFAPPQSIQMPPQGAMSLMTPAMQALFLSKMVAANGTQ